jgi:hypothetical protein
MKYKLDYEATLQRAMSERVIAIAELTEEMDIESQKHAIERT